MAALDKIHTGVKNALKNDGWTITDDPFVIDYQDEEMMSEMNNGLTFAAERDNKKIAVETCMVISPKDIQDMFYPVGHYSLEFAFLEKIEPDRKLYLAVTSNDYESFYSRAFFRLFIEEFPLPLIVVDVEKEIIAHWIN